jgi:hypothetical protein
MIIPFSLIFLSAPLTSTAAISLKTVLVHPEKLPWRGIASEMPSMLEQLGFQNCKITEYGPPYSSLLEIGCKADDGSIYAGYSSGPIVIDKFSFFPLEPNQCNAFLSLATESGFKRAGSREGEPILVLSGQFGDNARKVVFELISCCSYKKPRLDLGMYWESSSPSEIAAVHFVDNLIGCCIFNQGFSVMESELFSGRLSDCVSSGKTRDPQGRSYRYKIAPSGGDKYDLSVIPAAARKEAGGAEETDPRTFHFPFRMPTYCVILPTWAQMLPEPSKNK